MTDSQGRRIAIVTGGASGLGLEFVRQLHDAGWLVANIDFNAEAMADLDGRFGEGYLGFVGDVTDEAFTRETVGRIAVEGHIDLLINNAGQPSFKTPTAYEAADVDKCLKGLRGMILWSVETLKATGERAVKIANVMSTAATRGNANESVYCAAKWGEKGYTKSLQAAYKGTDVKIVGVYPGGIDTDFYRESRDYVSLEKQHSFMRPDELARVILFNLVNDANLTVSDIRIERNS
ncbi:SDR family oxidoreductase [Bifidobacterium simiarum]|uniref:SDR family oxidoreductase n=1 Tax=Bifidobacterium simiarum TaxID=2045441 RepID=UPI001BDC69E0|nr:SDR family oxidoreductase [Bifidobacterium simiarum]MBT1166861.1 SDR family oxidoreductase [Bifidobacterium simiarum]